MSYRTHRDRDDGGRGGGAASAADEPPMSRLFIICNKANSEEDFRSAFEQFGEIEEIWVVRDKHSGENKGKSYSITLLACVVVVLAIASILVNHFETQWLYIGRAIYN